MAVPGGIYVISKRIFERVLKRLYRQLTADCDSRMISEKIPGAGGLRAEKRKQARNGLDLVSICKRYLQFHHRDAESHRGTLRPLCLCGVTRRPVFSQETLRAQSKRS